MSEWHWADFLAPLDTTTILWCVFAGSMLGVGWRIVQREPVATFSLYWMLVRGAMFFVPLAVLRAFNGSEVYERLIGTLPLWVVFSAAIWAASRITMKPPPR